MKSWPICAKCKTKGKYENDVIKVQGTYLHYNCYLKMLGFNVPEGSQNRPATVTKSVTENKE